MEGKVKVKLRHELRDSRLKYDLVGYIDSYIKGADDKPYAVVVIDDVIDMIALYNLTVVK